MIEKHKTREGDILFISQMDDSHLLNTIHMMLRQLQEAYRMVGSSAEIDPIAAAMYGVDPKRLSNAAKEVIPPIIRQLYPYVMEATLRGIAPVSEIQATFKRSTKEQRYIPMSGGTISRPALLKSFEQIISDEIDDDCIDPDDLDIDDI